MSITKVSVTKAKRSVYLLSQDIIHSLIICVEKQKEAEASRESFGLAPSVVAITYNTTNGSTTNGT